MQGSEAANSLFSIIRAGESGLLPAGHQLLICTVEILKKNSGKCLPKSGEGAGCLPGKYEVFDPSELRREPISFTSRVGAKSRACTTVF